MMLKIAHFLLFVFATEISQDVLAESSSCSVPIIENGEMGNIQTLYERWDSYEEFKEVLPGKQIISKQTLLLRCRNGYLPIEDSKFLESNRLEVTCIDGAWSTVLRCEQTSCTGEPPATKNGKPVIGGREHGFVVWYQCNDRNHIKVRGNVTCHFGTWIGTVPKCLNYPCFTRTLNYPGLVKPPQQYLESQESFEIECENGFRKATSARKMNCNKGKWDISQNPCTDDITCPWFSPGNDLNVSYSNANKVESWATFSCAANAKLVGTRYAGCRRDGIWTSTQPYCEGREKHGTISTTPPGTTSPEECFCTYDYENIFVKAQIGHRKLKRGDNIMLGETVSFECKFVGRVISWQNGVRFFGKANMTCSTCKKWQSKDLPTCNYTVRTDAVIGYEDDLKILPGGVVEMRKGESRQFFCSSSWKQPQWDYGEKKGVSVTITQVSEQENVIFVSLLDIMGTNHEHSGKYECFMRVERDRRIGSSFLDLQFDDNVSCSIFPDSPGVKITYSRNVSVGSIATFSCSSSSKNLIGSSVSVCRENGSWSNPLPSCETSDISCPPVDGLGIFIIYYDNYRRINSTANFVCKEHGKRLEGSNVLSCLPNGTWSGSYPVCLDYVSCSRFSHSPRLKVTYSRNVSVGSIAIFTCSPPSKNLIGSSDSICLQNGSWSNPLPSCEESKCSVHDLSITVPEDVVPDMTGVNDEFLSSGSVVELKCNDNSIITGNSRALCGEHGKWELGSFQCVPGCILDIDPSTYLLAEPVKDSYRLGEFLELSCPQGRKLSNDVERLMCLGGGWSDSMPKCEELEESGQH